MKNKCKCGKLKRTCAKMCYDCYLLWVKNPKNNSNYKDGRTLKKYYCIECKNEISINSGIYGNKICEQCKHKKHSILMRGEKSSFYIDGRKNKIYYCEVLVCKNIISYGSKKCRKHSQIGHNSSKKTKRKMSLSAGGTGKPYENSEYGADFDSPLKERVRMGDKYICKLCGCSQVENGKQLNVHHIDYDKKDNNINNLISLCRKCHAKTNTTRKYWLNYFQNKINANSI